MKTKSKKAISIFLCIAMVLCVFLASACSENQYTNRSVFNYNSITYTAPNYTQIEKDIDKAKSDAENKSYSFSSSLNKAISGVSSLVNAYRYVDIEYSKNMPKWANERITVYNNYTRLYAKYIDTLKTAYDNGFQFSKEDEEFILNNASSSSPEVVALRQKAQELAMDYEELTVPTGSGENYVSGLETYSQSSATILMELVKTNNELGTALEASSFVDYQYAETYGRSYTPAQAQLFCESVKTSFAPIISNKFKDMQSVIKNLTNTRYPSNASVMFEEFFSEVSPMMLEGYNYMNECNLSYKVDFSNYSTAINGAYTAYLYDYNAPYMFYWNYNRFLDLNVYSHEFGHYTAMYNDFGNNTELDLAEVQSQSTELMLHSFIEKYYPSQFKDYQKYNLSSMVISAIARGALFDEWQRELYTNTDYYAEDTTRITDLYEELVQAYGLSAYYEDNGQGDYYKYNWALVPHTFNSPLYYLSYAMSAVPALSIYEKAYSDRSGGLDSYRKVLLSNQTEFDTALDKANIPSPLLPTTLNTIASFLNKIL